MDVAPPRGTRDWLPPESGRLLALYAAAHEVARRHGYRYVETPTFEDTALFARSAGETSDVVSKEMYTFVDRGDRSLTLRPEGTAPVVRAYVANEASLPLPFKAYYVETLFRYGRPQKGRLREFRTFGIEVVGESDPEADVEVIAVGAAYLRSIGVTKVELQVNSVGDPVCRPAYRELLLAFLEAHQEELRDEHRDRFRDNPMRVLDCKDPACRAVAAHAPAMRDHLCDACAEHHARVLAGVRRDGIPFVEAPTLARGLDYYTRTAFEFVGVGLSESQGTIIGGGRYDGLAEALGASPVAAVGFGSGIERALLAVEAEGRTLPGLRGIDAYVVFMGEELQDHARSVAGGLRAAGLGVDLAFRVRPLKAQMHAADRSGARFAVILGEREVAGGTVTWRRLADGEQTEGTIEDAIAAIGGGER